MAKEYDCRCNACGQTWSFNDADLQNNDRRRSEIKGRMAVGIADALKGGSSYNGAWQQGAMMNAGAGIVDYSRCPNCGSADVSMTYTEVENAFLDNPDSELYNPGPVSSESVPANAKSKVVAGVLAILLGAIGVHKFYLGYTKEGLITLVLFFIGGFISFGIIPAALCVVGWVEGIMYLIKDKGTFYTTYELGHKGWF